MPTPIINPRVNVMGQREPPQWLAKWTQFIPKCLIHDALNNPPISWYGNSTFTTTGPDQFVKYTYPREGCSEIHMIFTDTPCWTTCWNDGNSFIKALQSPKIEFVLAKHPWMENDCNFADILLPVNTKFEEEDIRLGPRERAISYRLSMKTRLSNPMESPISDYEIACMIAERFGLLKEYTGGKTIEDKIKEVFRCISALRRMISYEEFKEKGYLLFRPIPNGWNNRPV